MGILNHLVVILFELLDGRVIYHCILLGLCSARIAYTMCFYNKRANEKYV